MSDQMSHIKSTVFPSIHNNYEGPIKSIMKSIMKVISQVAQAHYESREQHYPT